MDVDEFMAFVETRPGKEHWELIEGIAVLMIPASIAQRRIAHNLSELLNREFEARSFDLFAYIGTAVRVQNNRHFQSQPDVVIIPGVASYDVYSEKFQLAGEIMSPTNTRTEIDLKLRRYREGPDNLYVVVIEPSEFPGGDLLGVRAGSRRSQAARRYRRDAGVRPALLRRRYLSRDGS